MSTTVIHAIAGRDPYAVARVVVYKNLHKGGSAAGVPPATGIYTGGDAGLHSGPDSNFMTAHSANAIPRSAASRRSCSFRAGEAGTGGGSAGTCPSTPRVFSVSRLTRSTASRGGAVATDNPRARPYKLSSVPEPLPQHAREYALWLEAPVSKFLDGVPTGSPARHAAPPRAPPAHQPRLSTRYAITRGEVLVAVTIASPNRDSEALVKTRDWATDRDLTAHYLSRLQHITAEQPLRSYTPMGIEWRYARIPASSRRPRRLVPSHRALRHMIPEVARASKTLTNPGPLNGGHVTARSCVPELPCRSAPAHTAA